MPTTDGATGQRMVGLLVFVLVPAAELMLMLQVGARIGVWGTLALIALTGVVGLVLARSEGLLVLARARETMLRGEMPHAELVDGILILVAGALLLAPGFITDAVGLLALFPLTRPFLRELLWRWLRRRVDVGLRGGPR